MKKTLKLTYCNGWTNCFDIRNLQKGINSFYLIFFFSFLILNSKSLIKVFPPFKFLYFVFIWYKFKKVKRNNSNLAILIYRYIKYHLIF